MANPEHLKILQQGVDVWNTWRAKETSITPDLIKANLGNASLPNANLSAANLTMANFSRANLPR